MKNNEIEKKQLIIKDEADSQRPNEISLVDIALIIIKHRLLASSMFILILISGTSFVLLQTDKTATKYNYQTTISIGNRTVIDRTVYLEQPATLLAKLVHQYIPRAKQELNSNHSIAANIPSNSGIIVLRTTSDNDNDEIAIQLLNRVSELATIDHEKYYSSIELSLNKLSKNDDTVEIALQLSSLKKTSFSRTPIVTKDTPLVTEETITIPAKNPKLILALTLVSGLILAVFSAFFMEFIEKIREKKAELNLS